MYLLFLNLLCISLHTLMYYYCIILNGLWAYQLTNQSIDHSTPPILSPYSPPSPPLLVISPPHPLSHHSLYLPALQPPSHYPPLSLPPAPPSSSRLLLLIIEGGRGGNTSYPCPAYETRVLLH